MSQAFYRKWRPQKWDQVVAQDHVIQTLRNAVRSGHVGHAYLLAGPRGTGKTTTARLLAKAVNCLDPNPANRPCDQCAHCQAVNEGRYLDLVEIDAASNTSVEDVRDLRDKINYRPSQGEYKVYIIDEVHMLSTAAFNALLKTLEEPPPHAKFILATTEVHKIPPTILSRCQRYDFRRIPVSEIVKYLKKMVKEEKLEVDEEALQLIARQATGAMRDAVSLLDQLSSTGDKVTLVDAQVVLGTATSNLVIALIDDLISRNAGEGLIVIQAALDSGTDARQYARQVVDYLRSLLLVRMGNADQIDATREMRDQMARHARAFELPRLVETIRLFNAAAADARSSWHPGLALELAFTEAIEVKEPAAQKPADQKPAAVDQPAAGSQPAAENQPDAQKPAARRPAGEPPEAPPEPAGQVLHQSAPAPAAKSPEKPRAAAQPPAAKAEPAGQPAPQAAPKTEKAPAEPAPAEPAPAAGPSAATGGRAVTQHELQQNWSKIKQLVKKRNPMTEGLLNSARSYVLKGDTLVLGFQSEVVKSKMETAENIEFLRQALQAVLGISPGVRCGVVGSKSSASDLDVDGDGMVGTALDLGGKIVIEE